MSELDAELKAEYVMLEREISSMYNSPLERASEEPKPATNLNDVGFVESERM